MVVMKALRACQLSEEEDSLKRGSRFESQFFTLRWKEKLPNGARQKYQILFLTAKRKQFLKPLLPHPPKKKN